MVKSDWHAETSNTPSSTGDSNEHKKLLAANVLQAAFRGYNMRWRPIERLHNFKRLSLAGVNAEPISNLSLEGDLNTLVNYVQAVFRGWQFCNMLKSVKKSS